MSSDETNKIPSDSLQSLTMHISGIVVFVRPGDLEETVQRLEALPQVEVHHRDPQTGRLVAVLETPDFEGQEKGLQEIQRLPGVLTAALAAHQTLDNETDEGSA